MTTIEEIIEESDFVDWSTSEQAALSKMMQRTAERQSIENVAGKTDRVLTTFIKILDTHLPKQEV